MSYRRLRITTPDLGAYYGVVDVDYRRHELASRWLEVRFYGRAQAETTSAAYASSVALFLTWAEQTGRDLPAAAKDLHLFAGYLATTPLTAGRSATRPRGASRVNRILVAVREFYRFAVAEQQLPAAVLGDLFDLPDEPDFRGRAGPRVRHRRREMRRGGPPEGATAVEVVTLVESAHTYRDRFMLVLMAVTGLRVGQVLGLRRQDIHFVPDAGTLGLPVPGNTGSRCRTCGEHLHVVRRANPNGAWSKARFDFVVPVPPIVVALYDRYLDERDRCPAATDNDMLIVALRGPTQGNAISPRNLCKIVERLATNAGLRPIHPHMLRHFAASEHLAAGTSRDELQALFGWSQPSSADPYIHVGTDRTRAAVDRLAARLSEETTS